MLFTSFTYLVFFCITVLTYYCSPHRFRWMILLVASVLFYMAWKPIFILLILLSTIFNYIAGVEIYKCKIQKKRKRFLLAALVLNFGLLFVFKYLVFMNHTFMSIFGNGYPIPDFDIILPLGISFHTFQGVGYVVDVYRRELKPEKNIFRFTLFEMFFPQMVAGPIERAKNLLPQLFVIRRFDPDHVATGLKYIAMGLFKKIVIADRLAVAVNTVYNAPLQFEGLHFVLATVLFAFQIYCDFSGYSEMALGCAHVFGIDLTRNFDKPYLAISIKDFWRRWHISLSTWFKDYVYIPLGGSRVPTLRFYANTMITFLLSGIWHGANWTFVIWGALHGFYQIVGHQKAKLKIPSFFASRILSRIVVFGLVCFAWIFFRANTVSDAFYIAGHLFDGISQAAHAQYVYDVLNGFGVSFLEVLLCFGVVILLVLIEQIGQGTIHEVLDKTNFVVRFCFYFCIVALILCLGVFYNAGEFIYFQF